MSITAITIPLQEAITVGDVHHGAPVELPAELMQAIDAWQHIVDDGDADRVAATIQERINQLCQPTHF